MRSSLPYALYSWCTVQQHAEQIPTQPLFIHSPTTVKRNRSNRFAKRLAGRSQQTLNTPVEGVYVIALGKVKIKAPILEEIRTFAIGQIAFLSLISA